MTTSESTPCSRSLSLVLKPPMTLLTTIRVATPSMTLTIHTIARKRVRRYRQQSNSLYMTTPHRPPFSREPEAGERPAGAQQHDGAAFAAAQAAPRPHAGPPRAAVAHCHARR